MLVEFRYPVFDPPKGGVENYILSLVPELIELGHDVQVCCGPASGPSEIPDGLKVFRHDRTLPSGPALLLRPVTETSAIERQCAVLERPQADVAIARHPSYVFSSIAGDRPIQIYVPAVAMPRRCLAEGRNGRLRDRIFALLFYWQWRQVERRALMTADRVVVLSENMRRQMSRLADRPMNVVPAGVDGSRFRPGADEELRRRLLDGRGDRLVMTMGRLAPEKNVEYALDVLSRMELRERTVLAVVGDGDLLTSLKVRARRNGVEERVRFVGLVRDPGRYLASADLLLHTAVEEPFGHVLLEAQACGTAVAAGASSGGRWLVATEELLAPDGGICLPLDDPDEAARRVDRVLSDFETLEEMGLAARRHVVANYSWARHAREICNLLK